jgi:hypothetical protein
MSVGTEGSLSRFAQHLRREGDVMKISGLFLALIFSIGALAQTDATAYTPKFRGDPAHSNAEASALGYMRTVGSAQRQYKAKHGAYATSLPGLVGTGSFTRRMTATDRGDYTVKFHSTGKEFSLSLVPKTFDAEHRAFYMDETGKIRAEDSKPATANSDPVTSK